MIAAMGRHDCDSRADHYSSRAANRRESYLLIDAATGDVLASENARMRLPPASLTKIMTSYIIADEIEQGRITLDDRVPISVKAWRMEGSRMFIREGRKSASLICFVAS